RPPATRAAARHQPRSAAAPPRRQRPAPSPPDTPPRQAPASARPALPPHAAATRRTKRDRDRFAPPPPPAARYLRGARRLEPLGLEPPLGLPGREPVRRLAEADEAQRAHLSPRRAADVRLERLRCKLVDRHTSVGSKRGRARRNLVRQADRHVDHA